MIAVLAYHGWEIDPERLIRDVRTLRENGWRDLSLGQLETALSGRRGNSGRFFHVTSDDGGEGDREFAAALRLLGCPGTFFVPLAVMSDAALAVHRELLASDLVRIEDHSLRHGRAFHYRHVIGFHCDDRPFMGSPERLGLALGSPVCMYGGELVQPRFTPTEEAVNVCQEAAKETSQIPGSALWSRAIAEGLLASRLGFRRLGKLCIRGSYESWDAFRRRVGDCLAEGKRRLGEFIGRAPIAFAHPWWQPSPIAEAHLREIGYRLTFSGMGLCRRRGAFEIPRVFVNNETPRPLVPQRVEPARGRRVDTGRVHELARQVLYA